MLSIRQLLSEGRALAQNRTLPVDNVDGDDEGNRNAEEDGRGVFEMELATDVYEEWSA
jgi:hypothetical protein